MQEESRRSASKPPPAAAWSRSRWTARRTCSRVKIDPEVAGDVEMLQDMVLAACNEADKKVEDADRSRRWAACSAAWACRPACSNAMPDFAEPLARLITEFKRLPGIGQKSAQRMAFHVLRAGRDDAERLSQAILDVKDKLGLCRSATTSATARLCQYCRDPNRDQSLVCVVEEPHNILAIETTRQFNGVYHVLHGALSPLRGIGPEQLRIKGPGGAHRGRIR